MDPSAIGIGEQDVIPCPICHQEFDVAALGFSADERNRFVLAHRLQELRARSGLTAAQVGARLGVTHSAIIQWEHGARELPLKRALQLAALYGIDMNTLTANLVV